MEAIELLKNKFGVSQKYLYELKEGEETVLEIYWNPLTIAERESIVAKSGDAGTLQEIQLAMLGSGEEYKVEEAKADLKS